MPLAWDPGQVHGPLARTAEDAALMLDAMVGFSTISPISVHPPWSGAAAAEHAFSPAFASAPGSGTWLPGTWTGPE